MDWLNHDVLVFTITAPLHAACEGLEARPFSGSSGARTTTMLGLASVARWFVRPVDTAIWFASGVVGGAFAVPAMLFSLYNKGSRYEEPLRPAATFATPLL